MKLPLHVISGVSEDQNGALKLSGPEYRGNCFKGFMGEPLPPKKTP